MSRSAVRILRIGAVIVPLAVIFLVLHLVAPGLRSEHRVGTLPEGYRSLRIEGPYEIFARPGNAAAPMVGRVLESFRRALFHEYGRELSLVLRDSRFHVIVFSSHHDLQAFTRQNLGSDFVRNAGFYLPQDRALGIIGDRRQEEIRRPLLHEGMHMILDVFVEGGGHDWSRWLDEGIASYFEASTVHPGGRVRLGGFDPDHLTLLLRDHAMGRALPVAKLFTAGSAEFEGEENHSYYATTALLVHLLLEGREGTLRERFIRYYQQERRPGPVAPGAFAEYLGEPADLDRMLYDHLLQLAE